MRVTKAGKLTIPKDLRDRLGMGPGTAVEFEQDHDADPGRLTEWR